MYKDVIGILGGMGSFATLHFFAALLKRFPAEKEWERPRVLIDNRCTMPSRVLAVLEGVKRDQLVDEMCSSVQWLLNAGATKLVLACNTSHCFLPDIYHRVPGARNAIVNIIEKCCKTVAESGIKHVGLIASEGTIQSKVFECELDKYGITMTYPHNEQFALQRKLIEAVKQDSISDTTIKEFVSLLHSGNNEAIILGCTEFPVLFSRCNKDDLDGIRIFDPLLSAIDYLKENCI